MLRTLTLLALLLPALAFAEAPKVDRSMVVLDVAAQSPDDAKRAQSATALITAELARRPGAKLVTSGDVASVLGVEKQKQLLGCTESACIAEIGGALGARYIVSGQLARIGQKLLLTASVVDSRTARSVARPARTLDSEDDLIASSQSLAGEIGDAVGLEPPPDAKDERGFNLDLKLGNTLPALTGSSQSLNSLNLRLDFELGYFVTEQTSPFLGASLGLARSSSSGETLRFIPVLLGAKHYFRPGRWVQPYVGGGLGLGFLAGTLGKNDGAAKTSFAVTGIAGLAYLPWRHVGFNVEASGNLSGVKVSDSDLLVAFNLDAGVLFLF